MRATRALAERLVAVVWPDCPIGCESPYCDRHRLNEPPSIPHQEVCVDCSEEWGSAHQSDGDLPPDQRGA